MGNDGNEIPHFPGTVKKLRELSNTHVTSILRALGITAEMAGLGVAEKRKLLEGEVGIILTEG